HSHRIACVHDDRDLGRCLLRRLNRRGLESHNHIDVFADKFRRQLRKAVCLTFSRPNIKLHIGEAYLAEALLKRSEKYAGIWRSHNQYADGAFSVLAPASERPCCDAAS